ncbi:hypothetical protein [Pseudomonas sp. NMI795_08]|uniref:hypothetical protein n=1 Tax=Pseudomonas sp. NMI795_08 TaxID=2903144 RepID=UPI001E380812|nr:hypothetical protein [Pseudomonas sp. NMI795_08]MCE1119083.1 hypothetical protein [Pseudomonas sp. NMI795_08]
MSRRYRNGVGELAPKLILPAAYQTRLRTALATIEEAPSWHACCEAQARATGLVEGLELAQALEPARLERLFLLIEDATGTRLRALEREGGA